AAAGAWNPMLLRNPFTKLQLFLIADRATNAKAHLQAPSHLPRQSAPPVRARPGAHHDAGRDVRCSATLDAEPSEARPARGTDAASSRRRRAGATHRRRNTSVRPPRIGGGTDFLVQHLAHGALPHRGTH